MVLGWPTNPGKQVQRWNPFTTLHFVFSPHGEGSQGFAGGLQGTEGGSPTNSGKQKQMRVPLTSLHPELGPHVLGSHSSPSGTSRGKEENHTVIYWVQKKKQQLHTENNEKLLNYISICTHKYLRAIKIETYCIFQMDCQSCPEDTHRWDCHYPIHKEPLHHRGHCHKDCREPGNLA